MADEEVDVSAFMWADALGPAGCPMDPRAIAEKLVANEPSHADLKAGEVSVLFVLRTEPKVKLDKVELGSLALPQFGGKLGAMAKWLMIQQCGHLPDFVMTLDHSFWTQATPEQRLALVDHELTHGTIAKDKHGELRFGDDGRPVWTIRPHDIEEFDSIVERHGEWLPDITRFLTAAAHSKRNKNY